MQIAPYYQDDLVTLYHCDCLEHPELWTCADVLVTDPPYGLGSILSGGTREFPLWADKGKRSGEGLPWDSHAPVALLEHLHHFKNSVIWGGNYFPLPPQRGWLIWDKQNRGMSTGHAEMAWTDLDQPIRTFDWNSVGFITAKEPHLKQHPTQKPVALMEWCLQFLPTGTVADPFAGSGSTLVAAKALGRKAVGVELEEKYCEIAANRLAQEVLPLWEGGDAS